MGTRVLLFTLVYGVLSGYLYYDLLQQNLNIEPLKGGDLLLLTAHPDDETMFFGPTLIRKLDQLSRMKTTQERQSTASRIPQFHILCITNGDQDGNERQAELLNATKMLGLSQENVHILNDVRWKDGRHWDLQQLQRFVLDFISKRPIREVITFDGHGVSGHLNHRDLFELAVRLRKRLPSVRFLKLKSLNLIQKYAAYLDVWTVYLFHRKEENELHILGVSEYFKLLTALYEHRSQMVWFRKLYSLFSKYMFINILEPM